MMLYSKIAGIRSRQLKEKSFVDDDCKRQDLKLELQNDLDRLKLMDKLDKEKLKRDGLIKHGREVIMEQIRYRDQERQRHKEDLQKEREQMLNRLKQVDIENDIKLRKRTEYEAKMGAEVFEANRQFIIDKEKKKIEDQELDRKIYHYNLEKIRKEEEDLAEKQRIAEIKENETIQLRRKQEKQMDRNAELDFIRARRGNELKDREERKKEKEEALVKIQKMETMMVSRLKQKQDKEFQFVEQANQAKEEFEAIIKKQLEDDEIENKKQSERKKINLEHNMELR
jgi:hypothetical protein